jgi:hypothetical protein
MNNIEVELATLSEAVAALAELRRSLWPAAVAVLTTADAGIRADAGEAGRLAATHAATALLTARATHAAAWNAFTRRGASVDALWAMLAAMSPDQVARFDAVIESERGIAAEAVAIESAVLRATGLARLVQEMVVGPVTR